MMYAESRGTVDEDFVDPPKVCIQFTISLNIIWCEMLGHLAHHYMSIKKLAYVFIMYSHLWCRCNGDSYSKPERKFKQEHWLKATITRF